MPYKIVHQISDISRNPLQKYRILHVGESGFFYWIKYELITLFFGSLPGLLGLGFRKLFYPGLFKKVGKGVVFGRNITLRNPRRIEIGDRVVIDDQSVLDAKGGEQNGITIGHDVFISRGAILGCKEGRISLGNQVSLGPYSTLHAVNGSDIEIGDYSVLAGYCYLVGGANYTYEDPATPIIQQPWKPGVGIRIGQDVWLGAKTVVVDGVTVGDGCVVGAHSLVNKDLPPGHIAYGAPARCVRRRGET